MKKIIFSMVLTILPATFVFANGKTTAKTKFTVICDTFDNDSSYAAGVINRKIEQLKGVKSVKLSLSPNNIAITPNGSTRESNGQLCATVSYTGE